MRKIVSLVVAVAMLLSFVCIVPSLSAISFIPGDVNFDGTVNPKDSYEMKKILLDSSTVTDKRGADLNFDGTVNLQDSHLLKRVLMGTIVIEVPAEESVSIENYTVIYPQNATVYEMYAAEILCDYVSDNCNIVLEAKDDSAEQSKYEILVGNTNRDESVTSAVIGDNQYMVRLDNNKIVLQGADYMIGGAVGELTYSYMNDGNVDVGAIPSDEIVCDWVAEKADSVILMIGDGMGFNHIAFTQKFFKLEDDTERVYEGFIAEKFPNKGESVTLCISDTMTTGFFSSVITDSAAGATALATGWKTQKRKLGINGLDKTVQNVREVAYEAGMKTAVISTEPTTGATPSGFTVHTSSRYNTDDIIAQQEALVAEGKIDYLRGDVYDELLSETKKALDIVSTDSEGFYVMIEEAHIDKAVDSSYNGGDNTVAIANYVYRFNTAIQYAATFTAARPGTVLIVTADHETGALTKFGATTNNGQHSDLNVPVFAMGAGCEMFNEAVVDNTDIAKFTASVFGCESFGGFLPIK